MQRNTLVVAVEEITEENFNGQARHVHAARGDAGRVLEVDGEWLNVRWLRVGTVTLCHETNAVQVDPEEIRRAAELTAE